MVFNHLEYAALAAMDEYARQEAIEFGETFLRNYDRVADNKWRDRSDSMKIFAEHYTTSQLYEKYQQQKQQP